MNGKNRLIFFRSVLNLGQNRFQFRSAFRAKTEAEALAGFVDAVGTDTLHGGNLPGAELDFQEGRHSLFGFCNARGFLAEGFEKGRISFFKQGFKIQPVSFRQDHLLAQYFDGPRIFLFVFLHLEVGHEVLIISSLNFNNSPAACSCNFCIFLRR